MKKRIVLIKSNKEDPKAVSEPQEKQEKGAERPMPGKSGDTGTSKNYRIPKTAVVELA